MARAKLTIPASVKTAGELKPETTTCGAGDERRTYATTKDRI